MEQLLADHGELKREGKEIDIFRLFSGKESDIEPFVPSPDGQGDEKKHSILFDLIELLDVYIELEGGK